MSSASSSFLRRVLLADSVISGTTGIALALTAGALEPVLGLPAALLRYAGVSLLPFAAFVLWVAKRDTVSRSMVQVVIGLNAAWVAASAGLLLSGQVAPSGIGYAFVIGQAVAVAVLAETQYVGLRRTSWTVEPR
jgi:hypothetical protein